MSARAKSVDVSLKVKVISAVSVALRVALLDVRAIVGVIVSMVNDTLLFESAPSALALPVELENLVLATLTEPAVVLLVVGVKVTE